MGNLQEQCKYDVIKEEIRHIYWDGEDEIDLKLLSDALHRYSQILDTNEEPLFTKDRWFYYMYMIKYGIKVNSKDIIKDYIEKALQCNLDINDKLITMKQLVKCYEIFDKQKGIDLCNECVVYCSEHELTGSLANIIHTRGLITENIIDILMAIELYQVPNRKLTTDIKNAIREQTYNKHSIDYAYMDLGKIYCKRGLILEAQSIVNKIKMNNIKLELKECIEDAINRINIC